MACYTQEQIAEQTGVPRQTVTRKLEELPTKFPGTNRAKLSRFEEEGWKPPLFDIWNAAKNSNEDWNPHVHGNSLLPGGGRCGMVWHTRGYAR